MENRRIENWLTTAGPLALDFEQGLAAWQQYQEELAMLRAGAKYSDLGIGQRREEAKPTVLDSAGQLMPMAALADQAATMPGSIAHLKLTGVMRSQDGLSTRGITTLIQDFAAAEQNGNIMGVLLEVNSGGGEVTAAQMLLSALSGYSKPIVAWVHTMASGAVYGTLPADEIVASTAGAQIGSIGTMMTIPRGFADWYNQSYTDLYATKSSRKNEDFRGYLQGDTRGLQKNLDETNEIFLSEVQRYRPITDAAQTLSGAMFFAKDAKRRGLIDSIGPMNYAIKRLQAAERRRKNQSA